MSAAVKFGRLMQADAYMAGYAVAVRNGAMIEARSWKRRGADPKTLRMLVDQARVSNRELVQRLRAASARIPFADYDRERQISATGAFGRMPCNPPAGSIER